MFIVNAHDVWMLYVGRLIVGFAAGSFSVIAPIYISEIAAPEIRGALGTMFQVKIPHNFRLQKCIFLPERDIRYVFVSLCKEK